MKLESTIDQILQLPISEERRQVLQPLINYIQSKRDDKAPIRLNFICTHNSRRSQFSQLWAAVAAHAFKVEITSLSGGVEVTAFNERTVNSIKRMGFGVSSKGEGNPKYEVDYALQKDKLIMFSKLFDDEVNQVENFAAVMTCDHADENCPFIPGTEQRISVQYVDPKAFDDTPQESEKYDERSYQIASEMFYVFSKIQ
ncbi:MAG: protein-tyrosine-phosphatase [Salibacteraceae bacterium]